MIDHHRDTEDTKVAQRRTIRVVHAVDNYLKISENWIYPQVVSVPRVDGRVVCGGVLNLAAFPLSKSPLRLDSRLQVATAALRLKWWKAQVVHAHFGNRAWKILRLKQRLSIPMVTSFYGYDAWQLPVNKPFWRERYQKLFAAGEMFVVEGPAMRQRLTDLGCPESKIRIQRIGVNLPALRFAMPNFSNGLQVAMVGRFVEKKGLVDGLRACAMARSRGVKLAVTIVGDATDRSGEQIKRELHALASGPELAGAVNFTGFIPVEQTHALLREHNVFLCPSRHAANGDAEGGSPVVLTEAMALGLLCIGARHCDIPEVIVDGQTGYLCDGRDVRGMAHVIASVERNPDQSKSFTARGRKHVEQTFALDDQMTSLRSLYDSLLGSRPAAAIDFAGSKHAFFANN